MDDYRVKSSAEFVVISLAALRLCLAAAYEAPRNTPTSVYVELKLADILAEVGK